MKCPQCATAMREIVYEGVKIHTCDGCGGEFVGSQELCTIVKTREVVFGAHIRQLFDDHMPAFGIPTGEIDRKLQCPACSGPMRLVNYAADTGVTVDRCDNCGGVWLDHEEIEKVQIILENWQDKAPRQLHAIAGQLEEARRNAAAACSAKFAGSRFAFVNALINRLLDAA